MPVDAVGGHTEAAGAPPAAPAGHCGQTGAETPAATGSTADLQDLLHEALGSLLGGVGEEVLG